MQSSHSEALPECKVRTFRLSDYAAVVKLWVDAGLGFRPGDDIDGIKLKLKRDRDLFLVAEQKGKLVGTVMGAWDGRRGWIYHLGVIPSHQRNGTATRLLKEVESRMKRKGVLKVNALIYGWNKASIKFFSKSGYEVGDMKEAQKQLKTWKHEPIRAKKTASTP